MFIIHLLGYLILYILNDEDMKYIMLYFVQFIYLFVVVMIYDVLYPKASRLLVNNMCMLMAIGFVMIARLDFDKCIKQFAIAATGTILTFFIPWLLKRVRSFRNFGWLYGISGLVLLILVLFSGKVFGANLVLSLGPVSVQPGEFVKILYVLFVASMFNKSITFKQTVLVTVLAAAHVLVLVASNDLGAALIFYITYLVILYVSTERLSYLLAGLACGSGAAVVAYHLFTHVQNRVIAWRDPWSTIANQGYQVAQSLFAFGTGGWFGMGLGEGMPDKIPVASSDFIISAIGEELGVFFAICVVLVEISCFVMFVNIALKMSRRFYKLTALGLAGGFIFQVFLTVGGAVKFIPSTGVTLPLVSYGGSSVISTIVLFSIIQGMYVLNREEAGEIEEKRKRKRRAEQEWETEEYETEGATRRRAKRTQRQERR